jgi:hypothetical protein
MAVRLSALCSGRPLHPTKIPGIYFSYRLSRPQGNSAAGRIISIEKSNYFIGSRTHDFPASGIVPQPTMLPHVPKEQYGDILFYITIYLEFNFVVGCFEWLWLNTVSYLHIRK